MVVVSARWCCRSGLPDDTTRWSGFVFTPNWKFMCTVCVYARKAPLGLVKSKSRTLDRKVKKKMMVCDSEVPAIRAATSAPFTGHLR